MRRKDKAWAGPLAAGLAALIAVTLAAPPAMAAGKESASPAGPKKTTIAAAAAAKLARIDTSRAVRSAQEPAPSTADDNRSFFRSPRGVVVLALMVAGIAYTIYSANADDVTRSPLR